MMKKVTDLSFGEGILCDTEDEAIAICKLMKEANIVRRSNKKVSEEDTHRDDTRGNGITYFPKEGVYGNDKYDGKTSKYKIYPAVLFYLREEVIEEDWIDDVIDNIGDLDDTEYPCISQNPTWGKNKEIIRKLLEKHAPKQKFTKKEVVKWKLEYPCRNLEDIIYTDVICNFLKEHNLLSSDNN